jgi:Bacterial PH domain
MRWRPRRGRLVAHGLGVLTFVVIAVVALVMPTFRPVDRASLIVLGGGVAAALYFFGRCQLRAGPEGLTVVNVLRTTTLEWAEIIDAHMEPGEPWPTLDLADGNTIAAMGIQAADGERGRQALAQLRSLIAQHGEACEPGARWT